MQDMIYDDAPYIILFYDNELHAYRSDRFEGWTLQPRDGGVALFATGVETYQNSCHRHLGLTVAGRRRGDRGARRQQPGRVGRPERAGRRRFDVELDPAAPARRRWPHRRRRHRPGAHAPEQVDGRDRRGRRLARSTVTGTDRVLPTAHG